MLPPADGWEHIQSRIQRKPILHVYRRIAAVAVVLIVSSLTLWYTSRDVPLSFSSQSGMDPASALLADLEDQSQIRELMARRTFPAEQKVKPVLQASEQAYLKEERVEASGLNYSLDLSEGPVEYNMFTADLPVAAETTTYLLSDAYLLEKEEAKKNKWQFGAKVSPTYSFRQLIGSNPASDATAAGREQPLLSYSGGLSMQYEVNRRVSVQTGLYYNTMGQQIDGITVYQGFSVFSAAKSGSAIDLGYSAGNISTTNADIFLVDNMGNQVATSYTPDVFDPRKANLSNLGTGLIQSFRFLELPLIVRYKVIDRKLDLHILGGMSTNFLIGNEAYIMNNARKVSVGQTNDLNSFNYSSTLGLGLAYELNSSLSFNFEPTLKYYLNPLNQSEYISLHPYSFGVYSGFFYKF